MLNAVGTSTICDGVIYIRKAMEDLIWENLFPNVYQIYSDGNKRVAGLMYMILGELGHPIAQVNAGNILDETNVIEEQTYFHTKNASLNINKHLAFKFYNLAAQQNEGHVYYRLADFHYFGIVSEIDKTLFHEYCLMASLSNSTGSNLAYSNYNLGIYYQFEDNSTDHMTKAIKAYNASRFSHKSAYISSTILMHLAELLHNGAAIFRPSLSAVPYLIITIWVGVVFVLIFKRRI